MPRSINDSITALENARNDIVDALNSKIEGGGIEKTLKISEVAEKINSIKVGGGSTLLTFEIESVTVQDQPVENGTVKINTHTPTDVKITLTGSVNRQWFLSLQNEMGARFGNANSISSIDGSKTVTIHYDSGFGNDENIHIITGTRKGYYENEVLPMIDIFRFVTKSA